MTLEELKERVLTKEQRAIYDKLLKYCHRIWDLEEKGILDPNVGEELLKKVAKAIFKREGL